MPRADANQRHVVAARFATHETRQLIGVNFSLAFENRELQIMNAARMSDAHDGSNDAPERDVHRVSETAFEVVEHFVEAGVSRKGDEENEQRREAFHCLSLSSS